MAMWGLKRFVMLSGVAVCALIPNALSAAETYTPPPLFGGAPVEVVEPTAQKQPEPTPIIPPAPVIDVPASAPVKLAEPPPLPTPITTNKAALSEAASAAERVNNPVQSSAPIDADVLLQYPADRVAENAAAALAKMAEQSAKNLSVPDFEPYPDAPTVDAALKPGETKTTVSADGKTVMRKTVLKSPRVVPKGDAGSTADEKPKVAVYTRDEKTGTFKRNEPKVIPVKPRGKTDTEKAVARAIEKANARAAAKARENSVSTAPRRMPAVPPPTVESTDLLAMQSGTLSDIPALDDNLSAQILSAADTSAKSGEKVAPPLPSLNTANQGMIAKGSPDDVVLGDQHVLLLFKPGAGDLDNDIRGRIDENVTSRLVKEPALRVEIRAYAPVVAGEASSDRRLSLARGLAVREYLKGQGVDPARMNIRAMGANTERDPKDRVDVVFLRGG